MVETIMNRAEDEHVATRVLYFVSDKLCYDAEGTKEVAADDLFNLFIKGVVCVNDDVYYTAKSYDETTGINFGFPSEEG